jgi:hypothetical protein
MDDADGRRHRWIDARELTADQYMLVNFGHSHAEWQDNVDEARRDEIKERVARAAGKGLLSAPAASDILDRLAVAEDPTELELEMEAAGIPDIYLPRNSLPE